MIETAHALGAILTSVPAPTDSWAKIIGDLAWPALVGFLVLRFRSQLGEFANTLATRAKSDQNVRLGPFAFERGNEVVILDRAGVQESTETFEPDDIEIIEALYEFVADKAGSDALKAWISANLDPPIQLDEFLTSPEYAIERSSAYRDMEVGERI